MCMKWPPSLIFFFFSRVLTSSEYICIIYIVVVIIVISRCQRICLCTLVLCVGSVWMYWWRSYVNCGMELSIWVSILYTLSFPSLLEYWTINRVDASRVKHTLAHIHARAESVNVSVKCEFCHFMDFKSQISKWSLELNENNVRKQVCIFTANGSFGAFDRPNIDRWNEW